jgi:hypothetical protein
MKFYQKAVPDHLFHGKGRNFGVNWYTTIIENDDDGYYVDSSGNRQVLFKFRKQRVPEKYQNLAIDSFLEHSKLKHSNRGVAAGIPSGQQTARHLTQTGQSEGGYIASNISGYFDRPLREHRGVLGTIRACRTTSFTLNNKDLWLKGLPFLVYCSKIYKCLGGIYYQRQQQEYDLIKPKLKIPDTVFTTITSNYNWRTACHTDRGDFEGGLGNLVVVGRDFEGGYLGFPQFKVLIKIKPGDFLLMDVHQYHCNTPIKILQDGFRLSFVMYIRQDMKRCKISKNINNVNYFV